MTRLGSNPLAAAGRDTGFAAIEAVLSTLADARPPRPRDAGRRRPGRRLRGDRLARSGRSGSPGTAAACRRSTAAPDDRAFEARFFARTGRRAMRAPALPARLARNDRAPPRRRPPNRIDLDLRGSTEFERAVWHEGPRDPARRGPAVRLDRGRDRPAEGGPGGRDGARPQPGPADRARATGSSGADGMIGQYSLGGPAQQADDPRRGGRRSGRPRGAGAGRRSATSARTRPGSTACRPATTRGGSPSATSCASTPSARACGGRLPAVPATAGRRGLARLSTRRRAQLGVGRAAATRVSYLLDSATLDQPTMPTPDRSRPPQARAPPRVRLDRDPHPVRRLGLDVPRDPDRGRVDPAVRHGGGPVPPSPAWSMLGAVAIVRRGARRAADLAVELARLLHRRRAARWAAAWALVAWGEQTVPSGIAGVLIAMMPVWVAVLGRIFLRRAAAARSAVRRHRDRACSASSILVGHGDRGRGIAPIRRASPR